MAVCLDGVGPFGDPSQVNSANNGPYGDALTRELIPHVERRYRCLGRPSALHIWVDERDEYFLNEPVHLLDRFLRQADPPFPGTIFFAPDEAHGFSALETPSMLRRMEETMRREGRR